jgi:hypothetical protein
LTAGDAGVTLRFLSATWCGVFIAAGCSRLAIERGPEDFAKAIDRVVSAAGGEVAAVFDSQTRSRLS